MLGCTHGCEHGTGCAAVPERGAAAWGGAG